jgi:hypothetical protein
VNRCKPTGSSCAFADRRQGWENISNKRIALITGAHKGIGLETARQLGKEGITVLVGARDEKKGKGAAEELSKEGIDAHGVVIDVDSSDSIKKAAMSRCPLLVEFLAFGLEENPLIKDKGHLALPFICGMLPLIGGLRPVI